MIGAITKKIGAFYAESGVSGLVLLRNFELLPQLVRTNLEETLLLTDPSVNYEQRKN
jgi:hypothetical protein